MTVYILILLLVKGHTITINSAAFKNELTCFKTLKFNKDKFANSYDKVDGTCQEKTLEK